MGLGFEQESRELPLDKFPPHALQGNFRRIILGRFRRQMAPRAIQGRKQLFARFDILRAQTRCLSRAGAGLVRRFQRR